MDKSGLPICTPKARGLKVYISGKPRMDMVCAIATPSGMQKAALLVLQVHNLVPQSNLTSLLIY